MGGMVRVVWMAVRMDGRLRELRGVFQTTALRSLRERDQTRGSMCERVHLCGGGLRCVDRTWRSPPWRCRAFHRKSGPGPEPDRRLCGQCATCEVTCCKPVCACLHTV